MEDSVSAEDLVHISDVSSIYLHLLFLGDSKLYPLSGNKAHNYTTRDTALSDTIPGEVNTLFAKLHMLAHAPWCSAFEGGWSRRALGKDESVVGDTQCR